GRGPSTDRLRTEPALSAEHRDRSAHRRCRSSGRLRGRPVLPTDRPRARGHEGLGPPHARPLRGKRRGPHPVVRGPGSRGAIGEGGRAFRRPPSDARVPREPDPARVGRVRRGVRSDRLLRDPEEEFRGLVVQAFLPPPETAVGWLHAKGDAGRYGGTEAGRRAWRVARALAERKPPSLLILKS